MDRFCRHRSGLDCATVAEASAARRRAHGGTAAVERLRRRRTGLDRAAGHRTRQRDFNDPPAAALSTVTVVITAVNAVAADDWNYEMALDRMSYSHSNPDIMRSLNNEGSAYSNSSWEPPLQLSKF